MMIIQYIAYYLVLGLVPSLLLELACRKQGFMVSHWERICLISLWPIMASVFIWNFVKGFFKGK